MSADWIEHAEPAGRDDESQATWTCVAPPGCGTHNPESLVYCGGCDRKRTDNALAPSHERALVDERISGGGTLHRATSKELERMLTRKPHLVELFDLSDPACPVIVKRCAKKGCEEVLRFPCPGGVPPLALQFVTLARCAEHGEELVKLEEEARGLDERAKRLKESGIPNALLEQARWENIIVEGRDPDETQHRRYAIDAARAWAKQKKPDPRGLFLYNRGVGTGKTLLAATAAAARTEHSPVRWVSVAVLVAELDGAWNDAERQKAIKTLTAPGALVLDDVDKIPPNTRARQAIFAAIEQRDQHGSPIIVTTNMGPKQLTEHFGGVGVGEAAVSRLAGPCHRLPYPGPDRRLSLENGVA
jgi:DNA replication protein DnaC